MFNLIFFVKGLLIEIVATKNLENEMLADLAEQVPDYLVHCREDNTVKKVSLRFQ